MGGFVFNSIGLRIGAALGLALAVAAGCSDSSVLSRATVPKAPGMMGSQSGGLVFQPSGGSQEPPKELPPVDVAGMQLVADCPEVLPEAYPGYDRTSYGCRLRDKKTGQLVKGGFPVKSVQAKAADGTPLAAAHSLEAGPDGTMRIRVFGKVTEHAQLSAVSVEPQTSGRPATVDPFRTETLSDSQRDERFYQVYKGDYFYPEYNTQVCNSDKGIYSVSLSGGKALCPQDSVMMFFSEDYRPAASMAERPPQIACCQLNYQKLLWSADHTARGKETFVSSGNCPTGAVATGIVDYPSAKKFRCTETDGRLKFTVPTATIIVPAAYSAPFMDAVVQGIIKVITTAMGAMSTIDGNSQAETAEVYSSVSTLFEDFSGRTTLGCRVKSVVSGYLPLEMKIWGPLVSTVSNAIGSMFGVEPGNDRPFPEDVNPAMVPICGYYERAIGQNFPYWNYGPR